LYEQGKRNIFLAKSPDWEGRKATSFGEDDGQEIDQLAWSKDGTALYFVRGGDFELGRENPNPAFSSSKPDQSIWILPVDGLSAKKMAEGNSPETCNDNSAVYYVKEGKIWSVSANSPAKELVHVNGAAHGLTCSPAGTQLAFEEKRKHHSFIGIYSLQTKKLVYPDTGVDDDQSPIWSPDGARVAYIRVAADTRPFDFGPVRETQPFSIRIIDCGSGHGHELWKADPGRGSAFSEIVASKQLFWTKDDHIAFPWEKTGWKILYAIAEAGGAPVPLTASDAEVEDVSLAEDGETVLYSTNKADIDRRHVWQARATGSNARELSSGEGIECSPVSSAAGIAVLASDVRHSSHIALLRSGKVKDLAPQTIPDNFPADQLVSPQQVILSSADGMQLHAQLFLPPRAAGKSKHPAIVFFHGGSRRQMLLGFHYMRYYSNAYAMNQYLASRGYIVLSVNYRSGIGYGMEFREALDYGATGASEFNDVLGAGLYLRSRSDVDPSRIGVWGGSYGGYLTALGLARASHLFQAGVDFHGVHDWNDVIENFVPDYDPRVQQEPARLAFASSPLASIDTWRSPVLLIHGDDDRNVPFTQTTKLVEALRKRHVEFELLVIPNEVHDFLRHESWLKGYAATSDFFDRKLAAK
jgi:dipeptidyl aminopeptidase/acylaminoacyl peptidase